MPTAQEIIDIALTKEEILNIREVINKNKIDPDNTVWEHEEWHSADGLSFQITKTVDDVDSLFEVTSENIAFLGTIDDLMNEEFDENLYDVIISTTNYFENFTKNMDVIRTLLSIEIENEIAKSAQYKLLYVNIITSMEVFFSDTFLNTVLNNDNLFKSFIQTTPEFGKRQVPLNEIYTRLSQIKKEAKVYLLDVIYHNISVVSNMYKDTFGIQFPRDNIGLIYKAIETRHDIVHRNGKNKSGDLVELENDKIERLIQIMTEFVENINKQLLEKI